MSSSKEKQVYWLSYEQKWQDLMNIYIRLKWQNQTFVSVIKLQKQLSTFSFAA